jgi:KipI family sensor histidine kinase inhibitor
MTELLPMGDRAVIVTGMTDPAAWALELRRQLDGLGLDPIGITPAAETVLVSCASAAALAALVPTIQTLPAGLATPTASGADTEIPVVYDGDDLAEVARMAGLNATRVVDLHSEATYVVAFCGFAPGFAYLRGLPSILHVPRRSTPRARVPAGSLAIASEYCAVYPRASPGGWNLLGTTTVTLFDGTADSPALLRPGDRVRFVPVTSLPERTEPLSRPPMTLQSSVSHSFTVIEPGVASSVQDEGRSGFGDLGVSPSGMVDPALGGTINRFVGNAEGAALLETCGGLSIRADRPLVVASSETIAPTVLSIGDTFSVSGGGGRRWHYLSIRGGIVVEQVLGSSSTDTLGGLGPPPLAAGRSFAVGVDPQAPIADAAPVPPVRGDVRIAPGPRLDWCSPDAFGTLLAATCTVSQASRIGIRFHGPRLKRLRDEELPSEGLIRGAIQLVPSGELVMMLADHPTTGGYPVVAVVHPDDVHNVAQRETFTFVSRW